MGSQFMQQFMAGWQMGQGRNENTRRNQELALEQQRQQEMMRQRAQEFEMRKEEFAVRKKQLAAQEAEHVWNAKKEAAAMMSRNQQTLPPETQDLGGGTTLNLGAATQPRAPITAAIPYAPEGTPEVPMMFREDIEDQKRQQLAMELERLGVATDITEGIKARYRKPERPVSVSPGGTLVDPETGRVVFHAPKPPDPAKTTAVEEYSPEDVRAFPVSWRDTNEGTRVQESYTTRNNNRATAMNAALQAGAVLPSKKGLEEAMTAQQLVAQAERIKALLDTPIDPNNPEGPKAKDYFGPAESRMAGWRASGFGPEIPAAVIAAREAVGRFAARDRHEIYGAAVTPLESKFAATFIADMNAPGKTLASQLDAYISNISNGMDATWGQGTRKKDAATPPAPAPNAGKYKIIEVK